MRRYVLGNVQSENMFINGILFIRDCASVQFIKTYTPSVTATGFSMHEIEIFDFVMECGEKRIAVKHWNVWINYEITQSE